MISNMIEKDIKQLLQRQVSTISTTNSIDSIRDKEAEEIQKNEEEIGLKGKSASYQYFQAAGNKCVLFMVIFIILMCQFACSATDYFVSFWTAQEELRHKDTKIEDTRFVSTIIKVIQRTTRKITSTIAAESQPDDYYSYESVKENKTSRADFDWDLIFKQPIDTNWAMYIYSGLIIIIIIILTLVRSFEKFDHL